MLRAELLLGYDPRTAGSCEVLHKQERVGFEEALHGRLVLRRS